uniref:Uncharacterized protein n=1 Tax=Acrobeloides nanus TaxID=290746 RepID=A0A914CNT3_9BILA
MRPFKKGEYYIDNETFPIYMSNKEGLSNNYTDQFYEYEPRPRCDVKNCGSKYLFCDNSKNQKHCGVKIKVSGNCSGLLDSDNPCYNGWCRNIDDGRPCSRCKRGSCVTGQSRRGPASPPPWNPPVPNQNRNSPPYTPRPHYRTTPRPHTPPSHVTHEPGINVDLSYPASPTPWNTAVSNQNRNSPPYAPHPLHRTTPRPYTSPSDVTHEPGVNIDSIYKNVDGHNVSHF